jgi:hypothetical protein
MQLIYVSRPFGFDAAQLDDILLFARARNPTLHITGALISRRDLFVQMLEGPRQAVTDTFGRISQDDRHVEVSLIHAGAAEERLFPNWSMRDDPVQSWMWTPEQVAAGAAHKASAEEARAIFARLAAEPR